MDENVAIKRIVKNIYSIDYSQIKLEDKNEFIVDKNGVSDFVNGLKLIDKDNGIIVMPINYTNGLFYSSENGGEIYSSPKFEPEIVNFSFDLMGLKRNSFYKLTITARTAGNNSFYNSNRKATISTSTGELILEHDFKDDVDNTSITGVFCAVSQEIIINFAIGKINIKNITIDEVELVQETIESEEKPTEIIKNGSFELAAYGIFEALPYTDSVRFVQLQDISSHGISLFFDNNTKEYIIERDNKNDVVSDCITNMRYILYIDLNKNANYQKFIGYAMTEISSNISPNTLKQGFYKFVLTKPDNTPYRIQQSGRIGIYLFKLN